MGGLCTPVCIYLQTLAKLTEARKQMRTTPGYTKSLKLSSLPFSTNEKNETQEA